MIQCRTRTTVFLLLVETRSSLDDLVLLIRMVFFFADNTIGSPLVQCNDTSEEPSPSSAAASVVSSTEERLRQIASISSDAAAAARERERALMRLKSADRGTLEREHRVTTTENPVDTLLIYRHNAALQQQQQT
mmetsp:Transcript_3005/g.6806  ORF Transcript_3005/g.6806 Transcript_3005/m.6806 type:complete len:134 (+) Transcript_3005:163-564(+)